MWTSSRTTMQAGGVLKFLVLCNDGAVTYRTVVDHWSTDHAFRQWFIDLLAEAPFAAYFWETPPLSKRTADQPFEFVLVNSPQLAGVDADHRAFDVQFESARAGDAVISFANLSGDAVLVAPCPAASPAGYAHLAAFSRQAPLPNQHLLWQRVGELASQRLAEHPLWLSTSGLGVYWLHVRLDATPKYYTYAPYRAA